MNGLLGRCNQYLNFFFFFFERIFSWKWWFSWVGSGHVGSNWHWPVIFPLQRVGGSCCSVKPASRIALLFRNHWTQSLSSSPLAHLFAWNGRARMKASLNPTNWIGPKSHHIYAPTWVTSSRYWARQSVSNLKWLDQLHVWHPSCTLF